MLRLDLAPALCLTTQQAARALTPPCHRQPRVALADGNTPPQLGCQRFPPSAAFENGETSFTSVQQDFQV